MLVQGALLSLAYTNAKPKAWVVGFVDEVWRCALRPPVPQQTLQPKFHCLEVKANKAVVLEALHVA